MAQLQQSPGFTLWEPAIIRWDVVNVLSCPGHRSAASLSTGEQCQGVPCRAALSVLAIAGSIVLWGVDLRLAGVFLQSILTQQ